MRGHQSLLEARLNGYVCKDVWIHRFPKRPDYSYAHDPENLLQNGHLPEIHIYGSDRVLALDFRCLMGLNVHIVCDADKKLISAIKRFKPRLVMLNNGDFA